MCRTLLIFVAVTFVGVATRDRTYSFIAEAPDARKAKRLRANEKAEAVESLSCLRLHSLPGVAQRVAPCRV